jgi:diadenosine tetraphosphate (Ap4A) HIT family hydrolase
VFRSCARWEELWVYIGGQNPWAKENLTASSLARAIAILDEYPVTQGHTLVIPRRHAETYFDITPEEKLALWDLVDEVKQILEDLKQPDGYNIGINVGTAAGQSVMHLYIHVIPRYTGDMENPRGGVRHVIPEKGKY